jgi:hypothetical protein
VAGDRPLDLQAEGEVVRHVKGFDVEVAREDGTVWARTAPGAGWDDLGRVGRSTSGPGWFGVTRSLSAWRYRPSGLVFEQVQLRQSATFPTQREAVAFVVDERIAAGNHLVSCAYCGHDAAMHTTRCRYDGAPALPAPGTGKWRDCTCAAYVEEVVVPSVEIVVETGPVPVVKRMNVGWGG